jgi:hypothetical protein
MCGVKTTDPRPLPADEITTQLRELADEVTARLAGVATVSRETAEDTGVVEGANVSPKVEGAVSVFWSHSADDIIVSLGDCPGWELPRSSAGVETVRAIVDVAVAGSIDVGSGRGVKAYRARMPDGTVREDTHEGLLAVLLSMPWKPRLRWRTATPYSA